MRSIVTVTVAAAARALTTVENVKQELDELDGDDDDWIEKAIDRASRAIVGWCAREFARETVAEQFRLAGVAVRLDLARFPIASVTSIVENDETLTADDYEIDAAAGLAWRLNDGGRADWPVGKITVTYAGGYLLPADPGSDLPDDVEQAAINLVKAWWFAAERDPLVRSESVPGVVDAAYALPGVFGGLESGLPGDVIALLQPFKKWDR